MLEYWNNGSYNDDACVSNNCTLYSESLIKYIILVFDQEIYGLKAKQLLKPPDYTLILRLFFLKLVC